jgi:hypothetical protein
MMFRLWDPPRIQQIPPPFIQEFQLPIAHLNGAPNQIQLEQLQPMETNQVST